MVRAYQRIDTTADVGLLSSGESLKELFSNMAKGLFSLITSLQCVRKRGSHKIGVKAESLEDLMVAWLNELIFVHEVKDFLFRYFNITFLDNNFIEAVCSGETIDPQRHCLKMEVKAATYHQISIWQEPGGLWHARVILDV